MDLLHFEIKRCKEKTKGLTHSCDPNRHNHLQIASCTYKRARMNGQSLQKTPRFTAYKIPSTRSRSSPPASTPSGEIATCMSAYQTGCLSLDCRALSAASASTAMASAKT